MILSRSKAGIPLLAGTLLLTMTLTPTAGHAQAQIDLDYGLTLTGMDRGLRYDKPKEQRIEINLASVNRHFVSASIGYASPGADPSGGKLENEERESERGQRNT